MSVKREWFSKYNDLSPWVGRGPLGFLGELALVQN